ncbi:MAG TPA: adenylate/guanylate cyclase domain-containing protein [Candidatus Limnocylindria bacterium]|nr:adenylate/guanylate cyclase domain-containing protein [Candidatus Limnocylindria bacterium]
MLACPSCGEQNPERARFCLNCGAALGAEGAGQRAVETRRRVTVLFSDVAGSTVIGEKLDPEALREVMQRYFDAMRVAIERHEGTVEKFIGDAVMAVFGIPQLHEDDPLRAVRAAFEMLGALEILNRDLRQRWGVEIAIRTGINTGEVVAGDATTQQSLATGDVVNTAARLEQAAGAGEVLVGPETYRLVRHAVTADDAQPLELKGKAESVPARRVTAVDPAGSAQARRMDSPMVGRERQLRQLTDAADRSRDDRAPQLVTVLGMAGVGKSRLVHEFLAGIREQATVIRGRCLSYGDGITYWPLAEALRPLAGIEVESTPEAAIDRLRALLDGVPQAGAVATRVAAAIGLGADDSAASGEQETFWAIRRLFESLARRRPLVAVFDDVQWGTPTFLDLLEHIADWSRDAPILLLAIARPELLEERPTWGGGKLNATTLLLEPLDDAAVGQIVSNLVGREALPAELAEKIETAAEGNPFYVEELLSMLVDEGILAMDGGAYRVTRTPSEIHVPPSVELLLAARLDRLPAGERPLLGRAAVIGKRFGAMEVAQLSPEPERGSTLDHLMALVRKELVRLDEQGTPDLDELDAEIRFRFRHQLVRDAAYDALPKQERARLHEAFADWMESTLAHRLGELQEVVGYHLEQACQYMRSIGGATDASHRLAERAVGHLADGAEHAHRRGDIRAAIRLLERAAALFAAEDPRRLQLLPRLADYLSEAGRLQEALDVADEVLATPSADPATRAMAMELIDVRLVLGTSAAELEPMVDEALEIRRRLGEADGIARALNAKARIRWFTGKLVQAVELLAEALPLAKEADDVQLQGEILERIVVCRAMSRHGGPRDLADPQGLIDFGREHGLLLMEQASRGGLGIALAQAGDLAGALAEIEESQVAVADLGTFVWNLSRNLQGEAQLWFGNTEAAITEFQYGLKALQAVGERGYLSTVASTLALLMLDAERVDEARDALRIAEEASAPDDIVTQLEVKAAQARLLARDGELAAAESQARMTAVEADAVDYIQTFTWSRMALADVLRLAGRPAEASAALEEAAATEERRGNRPYAATLRRLASTWAAKPPAPAAAAEAD